MSDGRELTGSYGTWRGQEWELWSHAPEDGTLTVVQDGGESPGADWEHLVYPNRFARTPDRFYKTVDAAEVSDVHNAHATARLGNAKVQILGENAEGRLGVQTLDHMSPAAIYAFATKWGLEPYDRDFAFAWVEPDQLTDLMFERA